MEIHIHKVRAGGRHSQDYNVVEETISDDGTHIMIFHSPLLSY